MMGMLRPMTDWVREHRSPASPNNPFIVWQESMSKQVIAALDAWRDWRERFAEQAFFTIYGLPVLQAALGIDPASTLPLRRAAKDAWHQELLRTRIAELKARVSTGGLLAATVRAMVYAGKYRGAVDERGFEIVRRLRRDPNLTPSLSLAEFKALLREQFYLLLIDQEAALRAIPKMLPEDTATREQALDIVKRVLTACGPLDDEDQARLARITRLFGLTDAAGAENIVPLAPMRPEIQSKAS
jgi:hypothetical protein